MADVTVELGNAYIGSAYSPVVEITETAEGHTVSITSADPEAQGQLVTQSYVVPGWSDEEAGREAQEAARQAAESAREAAEDERAEAEQARAAAESGRANAEAERRGYEQARRADESARVAAEQARQAAESARAGAESVRQSAEQSRSASEVERRQAEHERRVAEELREQAEQARQSAEEAREAAEQARQADTAAAISAANTATADAQTAATAANTAAGEADAATDAAEAAAALATAATQTVTDAYFPGLAAGSADGVTGGGPTDSAAWLERTCPGTDGPARIGDIQGRTVRMVQTAPDYDSARWVSYNAYSTVTTDESSRTITLTKTVANTSIALVLDGWVPTVGHTYLISADIDTTGLTTDAYFGFFNGNTGVQRIQIPAATAMAHYAAILTLDAEASGGLRISPSDNNAVDSYVTAKNIQCFDLTRMFGAGNEPSTVAEFEALFPASYYPYDAGSLLSVSMEGVETTGRNLLRTTAQSSTVSGVTFTRNADGSFRVKGTSTDTIQFFLVQTDSSFLTVPAGTYVLSGCPSGGGGNTWKLDLSERVNGVLVDYIDFGAGRTFTLTEQITFQRCRIVIYSGQTVDLTFRPMLRYADANGAYEPHWSSVRPVPAATYFPNGMRSAGSAADELTEGAAVTRVGAVDLGTLTWARALVSEDAGYRFVASGFSVAKAPANNNTRANLKCSGYDIITANQTGVAAEGMGLSNSSDLIIYDAAKKDMAAIDFKAAMSGIMLHYELATPTTTPIDPPLNLTYRAAAGGTERIVHAEQSAPPTLTVTYGQTAAGIVASALAAIADPDGPTATANHAAGTYLTMGGRLYRVTTAIATGEAIVPSTNVTATTVMAEVLALIQ